MALRIPVQDTNQESDREYAYNANLKRCGKLTAALTAAVDRGWTVVDMRGDWRHIFHNEANSK